LLVYDTIQAVMKLFMMKFDTGNSCCVDVAGQHFMSNVADYSIMMLWSHIIIV